MLIIAVVVGARDELTIVDHLGECRHHKASMSTLCEGALDGPSRVSAAGALVVLNGLDDGNQALGKLLTQGSLEGFGRSIHKDLQATHLQ
eukprot:5842492-Pleurochrysis_carterae.AAC.1